MNNKGFMMAEVIVVSAIILVTLTSIYISYNKIISIYNKRVDYYDVKTLYRLAEIRIELENFNTTACYTEYSNIYDIVQFLKIDKNGNNYQLHSPIEANNCSSAGFKEYVEYLNTSVNFKSIEKLDDANAELKGLLVMEKCQKTDKTNCKYAYLEIYEVVINS